MNKEEIFKQMKEKFAKEDLDIPLKLAIDLAYEEGLAEGKNANETEEWKTVAETERVRRASFKDENDRLHKDIDLFNVRFNDFVKDSKKISIIK